MADENGLIQLDPPQQAAPVTTGQITSSPAPPSPSSIPSPPVTSYTPSLGTAAQAGATGYQSVDYTVDPTNGTVAGNLKTLLNENGDYLRSADQSSQQAMNDRGLLNSSIAIGAGEKARIDAALPIAQADASIYNQAMTNTANQKNAALQFGAGAVNSAAQLNAQLATSMNTTNANALNGAMSQEAQAANARALANIDTNTKLVLAQLDANNRALLQSSVGASNAYVQAVTNISNIATNPSLSKMAKDQATATQINLLREQLRTLGGISSTDSNLVQDLNLDEYFATVPEAVVQPPPPQWYNQAPSWYTNPPPPQPVEQQQY